MRQRQTFETNDNLFKWGGMVKKW